MGAQNGEKPPGKKKVWRREKGVVWRPSGLSMRRRCPIKKNGKKKKRSIGGKGERKGPIKKKFSRSKGQKSGAKKKGRKKKGY